MDYESAEYFFENIVTAKEWKKNPEKKGPTGF